MIVGIGGDLCCVERIRRSLTRFGDAYIDRLYSADERVSCEAAADPTLLYARAFCGKEACAKALGTGMGGGVGWLDIEVLQSGGRATLNLYRGALERLETITPVAFQTTLHVTCSGDCRLAQAFVVIAAVPVR